MLSKHALAPYHRRWEQQAERLCNGVQTCVTSACVPKAVRCRGDNRLWPHKRCLHTTKRHCRTPLRLLSPLRQPGCRHSASNHRSRRQPHLQGHPRSPLLSAGHPRRASAGQTHTCSAAFAAGTSGQHAPKHSHPCQHCPVASASGGLLPHTPPPLPPRGIIPVSRLEYCSSNRLQTPPSGQHAPQHHDPSSIARPRQHHMCHAGCCSCRGAAIC